ncbi:integral membrane sensor signal transduction histidine kinase [Pseudoxanthomonas suwonensis 11-1]|uniref:histidine kinase n=1 Tax=Pseudoxanthomonas suwonensis (strain 11-1) TaxID=743721 RepID=E6WUL5_PSEUU|nr:two-component system sensor histidine kinase CreC [Pseudoxanthomonas suwonensis]ADV27717.1 integral membrane sensor signal transduction histidine kinase [Pseudoxanthomonas suwonensis 11-1]
MRLGLRLFLGFILIVGLAAFFVLRVFVDEVKPGVRQAMESSLVDTANTLAVMAAADLKAGRIGEGRFARDLAEAMRRDPGARIWDVPKHGIDLQVTVTDARGIVVFDSRGEELGRDHSRWNDVLRTLRGEYGARSSPEVEGDRTRTVMHVAAPVFDPEQPGRLIGVLTVARPNSSLEPFIEAGQRRMLGQGAWLIGLSALVGVLVTAWLSRRIGRLARYARAVAAGEPAAPPPAWRDEIGDLGQALEEMRRKLEGKAYVEQYVQSLTHEMKSPLAAIRGAAELLQEPLPEPERQRFARSILEQQGRLTETIDKLLALAEVEQHGWLQRREAVDLGALLGEVATAAEPRLAGAGLELQLELPPQPLRAEGDGFLLRQALANLVDNALAFAPRGSTVQLSLGAEAGGAVIRVLDRGPGVPGYALERVFERFYSLARPDGRPRSSGLGLPFVREVARLHGGRAWLGNRDGGGAEAGIALPLA